VLTFEAVMHPQSSETSNQASTVPLTRFKSPFPCASAMPAAPNAHVTTQATLPSMPRATAPPHLGCAAKAWQAVPKLALAKPSRLLQ